MYNRYFGLLIASFFPLLYINSFSLENISNHISNLYSSVPTPHLRTHTSYLGLKFQIMEMLCQQPCGFPKRNKFKLKLEIKLKQYISISNITQCHAFFFALMYNNKGILCKVQFYILFD